MKNQKKGIGKWLKVLIAVVVVVMIGAIGYFGVAGELFQGRSFTNLKKTSGSQTQTITRNMKVNTPSPTSVELIKIPAPGELELQGEISTDNLTVENKPTENVTVMDVTGNNNLQKDTIKAPIDLSAEKTFEYSDNSIPSTSGGAMNVNQTSTDPNAAPDLYYKYWLVTGGGIGDYFGINPYVYGDQDTRRANQIVLLFEIENKGGEYEYADLKRLSVSPTNNVSECEYGWCFYTEAIGVGDKLYLLDYDNSNRISNMTLLAIDGKLNAPDGIYTENEFVDTWNTRIYGKQSKRFALVRDTTDLSARYENGSKASQYPITGRAVLEFIKLVDKAGKELVVKIDPSTGTPMFMYWDALGASN